MKKLIKKLPDSAKFINDQFAVQSKVSIPVANGISLPSHQQGVALLTVLLLVVAITVIAGSMLASQKISLRQYELMRDQNQIANDIRSAEQLAVAIIQADNAVNDNDSYQDVWAKPIAPFTLGTHQVTLEIKDASSRFNINNLYQNGEVHEPSLAVFKRLLEQLGHDGALAYAVLDWQDPDSKAYLPDQNTDIQAPVSETGSDVKAGAEVRVGAGSEVDNSQADSEFSVYNAGAGSSLFTRPESRERFISNQPYMSVAQLSLVKGFTPEIVYQLKPYITAVPYFLPINLNTASAQLISALGDGSSELAQSFVNDRKNNPGQDVDEMLAQLPLAELPQSQITQLESLLDIKSHGFYVAIDVAVPNNYANNHPSNHASNHVNNNANSYSNNSANNEAAEQARHRYATTFVSKIDPNLALNTESQANNDDGSNDNNTESANSSAPTGQSDATAQSTENLQTSGDTDANQSNANSRSNANSQTGNNGSGSNGSDDIGSNENLLINAFGTRLWTYKPVF